MIYRDCSFPRLFTDSFALTIQISRNSIVLLASNLQISHCVRLIHIKIGTDFAGAIVTIAHIKEANGVTVQYTEYRYTHYGNGRGERLLEPAGGAPREK